MLGVLPAVTAPLVVGVPTVLTDRLPGGGFLTGTTTLLREAGHKGGGVRVVGRRPRLLAQVPAVHWSRHQALQDLLQVRESNPPGDHRAHVAQAEPQAHLRAVQGPGRVALLSDARVRVGEAGPRGVVHGGGGLFVPESVWILLNMGDRMSNVPRYTFVHASVHFDARGTLLVAEALWRLSCDLLLVKEDLQLRSLCLCLHSRQFLTATQHTDGRQRSNR
ncbi:hypothetical protein EYF80_035710 [Liparis tanakae]|uniref:Uncharacterized protein n=1 Tax=Liparis tanakae TaxID=230148 RepID=A0A4Z2GL83_9TELE|nr:hypothetical protein EYF80_035710 [Liparis tanakae]